MHEEGPFQQTTSGRAGTRVGARSVGGSQLPNGRDLLRTCGPDGERGKGWLHVPAPDFRSSSVSDTKYLLG